MQMISIIIPVFNGEMHILECLESIQCQTYSNIEIICVDDGSTDSSGELLWEAAQLDKRIKIITQQENFGCARARRRGVLESLGDYILFIDQDDMLVRNACEILISSVTKRPVDILHFDATVIVSDDMPEERVEDTLNWVKPYESKLQGKSVFEACFAQNKYGYGVWGKLYASKLAIKAFSSMEDKPVPLGEDNYAYFVLAYFAQSYRGLHEKLYVYHYGRGFVGHTSMSLKSFERVCSLAVAVKLIRNFLHNQGTLEENQNAFEAAKEVMLSYVLYIWKLDVSEKEKNQGILLMLEQWRYGDILYMLLRRAPEYVGLLFETRYNLEQALYQKDESMYLPSEAIFNSITRYQEQADCVFVKHETIDKEIRQIRSAYEKSKAYQKGRAATRWLRQLVQRD